MIGLVLFVSMPLLICVCLVLSDDDTNIDDEME